ncbi:tetratricopeptide repeat protein [Pelagicoccus sp. SDUM812003]|uniref:tetratricopeptide repeat protein n=1 Tax=Pelagicoccus sp. SDUM812003 TaxID=3041267 RepID=UPI00280E1FD3|nr:tetratricopeptide repeat protein [Pelagicoccus sp. SDUM812003]MDQ8205022.1 tetratricopeptide repeat protein [Pelagicoccus sp. SDUM812003]
MLHSKSKPLLFVSLAIAVALAVGLFWGDADGRSIRSALPERPDTEGFPAALDQRLDRVESRLIWPWNDHAQSVLELSGLYHINGFNEEALRCYELALSFEEVEEDLLLYRRSDLASQMGNLGLARTSLQQCLEKSPYYLPARLRLAELEYKSGDADQALDRYRSILDTHETQPHALLAIARDQLRENRIHESIVTLKKLVLANPDFSDGFSLLSQALDRAGQDQLAAEIRENAPRRKPSPLADPWLDSLMDDCYDSQRLSFVFENHLKAGDLDRALELVDRMEAIRPNDPQAYQQRGYAFYQVGRYEDAADAYEQALAFGGDPSTVRYFLADALARGGLNGRAESVVSEEIARTGGDADLLVLMASLAERRDSGEQIGWLEKALAKDPYHIEGNRQVSRLYWSLGKRKESIQALEQLRQLLPQDLASRVMIGRYALEVNQPKDAIDPLQEAVEIDPENQDASALLALAYLRSGNEQARAGAFEAAIRFYDRAIDVSADGEEAYLNKVQLCLKLERYDLAEATVSNLIERRPNDPVLYVSLGDVRMASGDLEGARASWKEALQRSEGNRELLRVIEQRLRENG